MSDQAGDTYQSNKSHHKKKTKKAKGKNGRKQDDFDDVESGELDQKNDSKNGANEDFDENYKKARDRNPRAFALQSYVAAERQFRR